MKLYYANREIQEIVDSDLRSEIICYQLGHERQIGKNWEEIKTHRAVRIITKDTDTLVEYANGKAKKLANCHQCEVRWHYDWSNNGHYVQPDRK